MRLATLLLFVLPALAGGDERSPFEMVRFEGQDPQVQAGVVQRAHDKEDGLNRLGSTVPRFRQFYIHLHSARASDEHHSGGFDVVSA